MTYFVRIEDAPALRRRLLETSKVTIEVLKGYERILDLRDEKKELVGELQRVTSELHLLRSELERLLPEKSLREIAMYLPKQPPKPAKQPKQPKSAQSPPELSETPEKPKAPQKVEKVPKLPPKLLTLPSKPLTEMQRLEKALGDIDARLKQL
jgi:hypothetical protein